MSRIKANKDKVSAKNLTLWNLLTASFSLFAEIRLRFTSSQVVIYSPTFFKYVYESWLDGHGRYPSTGFLSLLLAIHICDKVTAKLLCYCNTPVDLCP